MAATIRAGRKHYLSMTSARSAQARKRWRSMDKLTLAFTALWTFLFLYSLLAAIDFGAGFLFWWAGLTGRNIAARQVIMRYLSPVWETTNVFLVFFIVGLVGYFPRAAATYGVLLLVPAGIALMLLIVRGAALA